MPSDKRRFCRFGHDWRVSFDGRFYYCYRCPAQWQSQPGQTPPQDTYKTYPTNTTWADNLPERTANTMPSQEFDDFLEADSDEQAGTKESWMKVRDMLYEPIRVTRGNIREEDDSYNPGKMRDVAYVHFHFLDDLSETPFVFSTSARAILNTVKRAIDGNEFPFDAAVIEILTAEPFNGYFPLRFTSLGKLAAAQAALEASNKLVAPDTSTPPAETIAPAASAPSKARAAATAHNGSANRSNRNLATRGN